MQSKYISLVLFFFFQTLLAQNEVDKKNEIKKLIQNATVEFSEARYDKSLELSKNALKKSFDLNDNSLIAQSYNTIGAVYNECSDNDRAIEYYNKALKYAAEIKNDTLNNWIYGNLGSVYYFNDIDVKKGIDYYKKSLEYALKIKDSSQIVFTKLNLASALLSIEENVEGIKYLNQIKASAENSTNPEAKMSYHLLQGTYNKNTNNPQLAEQNYLKALDIAEKNKMYANIVNIYESLASFYSLQNDTAKENLYTDKLTTLKNKIYSKDKLENINETALHISLDEYKQQLERVENENEKHTKKLNQSRLVFILGGIIIVFLLLLLLTLFKNYKTREKLNNELKHANDQLKIAKEKAEEASRLKTQFVSTITHELRTPLYGVVGITNIIIDEHKELANSHHLKALKFSSKYLLSLVNDILQMNKMEEKKIVLENHIFNLYDEIEAIRNSVEYIADKNNDKLYVEIDTEIPEFLIGDKLRLSQIIMNLVSNALKFTKNGEVAITADLVNVVDTMHYIEFKIKDTGIGIAKQNQSKIFEMFVQIARKEEDYQGTGLGLSIVSRLIDLFDSRINLQSEENLGTTFSFIIGFEHDEIKSKEIINNIEVDMSSNLIINILVVEDNKINQMVTKKIIESSNYTCTIVDDGYAALVALERERFDLIFMDINMPLINGFETTRKIREKGILTPIVALTAFDKQEVTEEALSSGMNDVMVKPFEPMKLYQVISNLVAKEEE